MAGYGSLELVLKGADVILTPEIAHNLARRLGLDSEVRPTHCHRGFRFTTIEQADSFRLRISRIWSDLLVSGRMTKQEVKEG